MPDPDAFPWDDEPDTAAGDAAVADAAERLAEATGPAAEPTPAGLALYEGTRLSLDHRDPGQITAAVRYLRAGVRTFVEERLAPLQRARNELTQGRTPNAAEVSDELRELADVYDALDALGSALHRSRDDVAAYLLDTVADTGRRSARTGDGHGMDLVVKIEQRTELDVDLDPLLGALRAALALGYDASIVDVCPRCKETTHDPECRDAYLTGVDDTVSQLRELLSTSPSFRTTALDAWATELSGRGGAWATVAGQLTRSYRRRPAGDEKAKVSHVEPAKPRARAGATA